jgi:serine/threonine protein kinase
VVGKTVSNFQILARLGIGGMSIVYKALDLRLGRFVALKFLLEKFCNDRAALEQFQQEARLAATVNHPSVCLVHDIGQYRELPYLVMEYLEGGTLRDLLQRGSLSVARAVACGVQIADALRQVHQAGIVHRDISPANLFLTIEGRVKLLDFGIAKLMRVSSSSQADPVKIDRDILTGTIQYMSPEQALCREVDTRSDIFSVGVVLYELLTRHRPFAGADIPTTIGQIIEATPVPLCVRATDAPIEIQNVVNRCLEKRPEQRYQTATDLQNDLRSAARVLPLSVLNYSTRPNVLSSERFESKGLPAVTIQDQRVKHKVVCRSKGLSVANSSNGLNSSTFAV